MRFSAFSLCAVLVLSACSGSSPEVGSVSSTDVADTTVPLTGESTTSTSATPTSTTVTPSTIPQTVTATIAIDGTEEVVFDWSEDRCETDDIPDLPARAFRDADGLVNLISTHHTNRRMIGPDLDNITRDCTPIFVSAHDPDAAQHTDNEWIASVYTEDGTTVYALVHDEYHGWEHGVCTSSDFFKCWYNTITLLVSHDGGRTFEYPIDPPGHLVASLPDQYTQDSAPVGLFSPSNIVRGPEDHYYALAKVGANLTGRQTVCLMRTPDLADPSGWRFWDGDSFDGVFIDPYVSSPPNPADHRCPALALDQVGAQMIESLTWNTYLEQWVLVGISADTIDGREIWGFYYSFSRDLVHWSRRELLIEIPLPWTVDAPGSDVSYLYPSLLDPSSDSLSFETTGETAYLYFTRNNEGHGSLDRDLLRIPVRFSRDN